MQPRSGPRRRPHGAGLALLILSGAFAAAALPAAQPDEPLEVADRVSGHYIATVTPALAYTHLLTLYGLARFAEASGRSGIDAFVDRTLRQFIAHGPATPLNFENYSMGGLAGAYRCVQKRFPGDPGLLRKYAAQLVNEHPRDSSGVFCHPREPGEKIWVDCLMAVCPFLSMAAGVLGKPRLHEESIAQYLGMERALLDPRLGLFHQSRNFGRPGVSVDTWGRGNGWALIGLAELIRWLPGNHPQRRSMIARLERLLTAIEPLQRPSGMWGQNLATPDSYEETSGTGLILYALAMGLRHNWLPPRLAPVARRAWSGLASKVDRQGAVHGACIGTLGKTGDPLEFWLNRPTRTDDPHAFGPVLLAATEMHLWLSESARTVTPGTPRAPRPPSAPEASRRSP